MSLECNSSTVERGSEVIAAHLASSIFIKSFELSSYNTTLQDDFFVGINKLQPIWSIDSPMKQEIFNISYPMIRELFLQEELGGGKESDESIKAITEERLSSMQHKFTGIKEAKGIGDPLHIAQIMILEDFRSYHAFCETRKFDNSDKENYASKFCNYVIEQQSTGLYIFDALFRAVKRDFEAVDFKKGPHIRVFKYLNLINDVVKGHVEANPEKEEFYKEKGLI